MGNACQFYRQITVVTIDAIHSPTEYSMMYAPISTENFLGNNHPPPTASAIICSPSEYAAIPANTSVVLMQLINYIYNYNYNYNYN